MNSETHSQVHEFAKIPLYYSFKDVRSEAWGRSYQIVFQSDIKPHFHLDLSDSHPY